MRSEVARGSWLLMCLLGTLALVEMSFPASTGGSTRENIGTVTRPLMGYPTVSTSGTMRMRATMTGQGKEETATVSISYSMRTDANGDYVPESVTGTFGYTSTDPGTTDGLQTGTCDGSFGIRARGSWVPDAEPWLYAPSSSDPDYGLATGTVLGSNYLGTTRVVSSGHPPTCSATEVDAAWGGAPAGTGYGDLVSTKFTSFEAVYRGSTPYRDFFGLGWNLPVLVEGRSAWEELRDFFTPSSPEDSGVIQIAPGNDGVTLRNADADRVQESTEESAPGSAHLSMSFDGHVNHAELNGKATVDIGRPGVKARWIGAVCAHVYNTTSGVYAYLGPTSTTYRPIEGASLAGFEQFRTGCLGQHHSFTQNAWTLLQITLVFTALRKDQSKDAQHLPPPEGLVPAGYTIDTVSWTASAAAPGSFYDGGANGAFWIVKASTHDNHPVTVGDQPFYVPLYLIK